MSDIIDHLAGITGTDIAELRTARPDAKTNAQLAFDALLEPEEPHGFPLSERYAIASYTAGLHRDAVAEDFYLELLDDETSTEFASKLAAYTRASLASGPYGTYRETGLQTENIPGPTARAGGFGTRLDAALDFVHLQVFHPRDSSPRAIAKLAAAGWTADQVVSLAQLVTFLAFQLRAIEGLRVLADRPKVPLSVGIARAGHASAGEPLVPTHPTFETLTYPDLVRPERFVAHSLGWQPWVPAPDTADLTEAQRDALVDRTRTGSAYFRLLARDPVALRARTRLDFDIFQNPDGGLPRAERELAATVTSRLNGCVYCASVHSVRAIDYGAPASAITELIDVGVTTHFESPLWNAVAQVAVAVTATPSQLNQSHIEQLRSAGCDDLAVLDTIYSAAFFNWANRLMLCLGEPELPQRFR
ncbi:alkylhydroperoxidase domain protein [Corynebacterium ulceribovis]|uniref:alkylhydroperoxidase domain protein n=1 Tax=Corynebacterium ulceribovis TaxID=487732 RepID=UPI000362EF33|nr:alkylhydroperoxidase domain protein [Corynebacterium ulceribovis]